MHERPLIRLDHHFLLAPNLFVNADAEECILRNWSKKHSGEYGNSVASVKKALERDWYERFRRMGWKAAHGKKLLDSSRRTVGDIDVCGYDPKEGHLLVLQLKWMLAPDDPKEVSAAEQHLIEASGQANSALRFIAAHPTPLQAIFGEEARPDWPLNSTSAAVLGRGFAELNPLRFPGIVVAPEAVAGEVLMAEPKPTPGQFVPKLQAIMSAPSAVQAWKRYQAQATIGDKTVVVNAYMFAHEFFRFESWREAVAAE